jgi:signal transduction histidine kinase
VLREILQLFDGTLTDRPLSVRVPDRPVPIRCDRGRLEQVLTNLLSNALKYSPAESAVEVRGGEAVFRVTDHGIGIDPRDLPRVFEPFRRVGLSRETVLGVGLGLFVVRRIVEAHGGRIEAESQPGQGSTFRVFLPLEPPRESAADPAPTPGDSSRFVE